MFTKADAHPQRDFWLVCLFMLAGAFVRLYGNDHWEYNYTMDELWHVYVASQPTFADVFYIDLTKDGHPLLPYFLWHGISHWTIDPWAMRIPSLIAGLLCIPAGYWMGHGMFGNRNAGIFTAFFMTFGGLFVEQSQIVRGYMLMQLFCVLAVGSVFYYRNQPSLRYLLFYFVSIAAALLCEFSAAPVAAFAALYLLHAIWNQPSQRLPALLLWAVMQIVLLAYLLWFTQALHTIGLTEYTNSLGDMDKLENSALENIMGWVTYLIEYLYASAVTWNLLNGEGTHEQLGAACVLLTICTAFAGVAWIVREKKVWLALFIVILLTTFVVFEQLNFMPFGYRRHLSLSFATLILLYGGVQYCLRYGLKNRVLRPSATIATVVATIVLISGFAIQGKAWRYDNHVEFWSLPQTSQEIMNAFETRVAPGDIILTLWLGHLYFWQQQPSCFEKPLGKELSYSHCHKAPVYVLNNDVRSDQLMGNLSQVQRALRELEKMGKLPVKGNVWFVSVEHTANLIDPQGAYYLRAIFPRSVRAQYEAQIAQMQQEQRVIFEKLYANAQPDQYAFAARSTKYTPTPFSPGRYGLQYSFVSLSVSDVRSLFIDHPDYPDPIAIVKQIAHDRKE